MSTRLCGSTVRLPAAVLVAAFVAAGCVTQPDLPPTPDPDARISAEILRLELAANDLKQATFPPELSSEPKPGPESLQPTRAAQTALLKLYRLRQPFSEIETFSFIAANTKAATDLVRFEELWKSRDSRFNSLPPEIELPALHRSLAQASRNRAEILYRASLAYAKIDSPTSGLYYLASAEASLRFFEFVLSLNAQPESPAQPRLDSEAVHAALLALENETLEAFGADPANNALNGISSRLKEARELFDGGRLDGAALMLLEVRLALSKRAAKEMTTPETVTAGPSIEPNSMRAMMQSRAVAEDPTTAAIIRSQLLPLYDALSIPTAAPVAETPPVTVTLVRWPYT